MPEAFVLRRKRHELQSPSIVSDSQMAVIEGTKDSLIGLPRNPIENEALGDRDLKGRHVQLLLPETWAAYSLRNTAGPAGIIITRLAVTDNRRVFRWEGRQPAAIFRKGNDKLLVLVEFAPYNRRQRSSPL